MIQAENTPGPDKELAIGRDPDAREDTAPGTDPAPKPLSRIIYVEDDDVMAVMVKDLLTDAGYLVGVIAHGTLAHETIAFKKPDLVILDRSLPGMQGLEILQRLRAKPETYLMPVLMLTAAGGEIRTDEGIAAGADGYLVKPFDPEMLVEKVVAVLKNSLFRRPR